MTKTIAAIALTIKTVYSTGTYHISLKSVQIFFSIDTTKVIMITENKLLKNWYNTRNVNQMTKTFAKHFSSQCWIQQVKKVNSTLPFEEKWIQAAKNDDYVETALPLTQFRVLKGVFSLFFCFLFYLCRWSCWITDVGTLKLLATTKKSKKNFVPKF